MSETKTIDIAAELRWAEMFFDGKEDEIIYAEDEDNEIQTKPVGD